jgi:hypothetical protein
MFRPNPYVPNGDRRPYAPNIPTKVGAFEPEQRASAPPAPVVFQTGGTATKIAVTKAKPTGGIKVQVGPTGNQPKVERRPAGVALISFNPAPLTATVAPPPTQISVGRPSTPQIQVAVPPPVAHSKTPDVTQGPPPAPIIVKIPQREPQPQPAFQQNEQFSRLSFLAFVTSFEEAKSFNETDLSSLGLDLKYQEPLLPLLHSVLSDAPLLDHSVLVSPECYSKIPMLGNPQDKLTMFSDETLMYVFYTFAKDLLQGLAADELVKRGWVYIEDTEEWRNANGLVWNVEQWKALEAVPDE